MTTSDQMAGSVYQYKSDQWYAVRLSEVPDLVCLDVARRMGLDPKKTWLWRMKK